MLLLFTSAGVKSLFQSLVTKTLVPEHTFEVCYVSKGIIIVTERRVREKDSR